MGFKLERFISSIAALLSIAAVSTGLASAQSSEAKNENAIEEISVIGISPLLAKGSVVGSQSLSAEDIRDAQDSSLLDLLDDKLLGVTLNQSQNNPLQPDLQYRGFAASSALGLQQGITVYHNGARINEPFGDTVNWDLLAQNTIESIRLVSGANPLFGLNSLGGSLILNSKTGFSSPGGKVELSGGSFGRKQASINVGGNNDRFGYFVALNVWGEDGWRDFSESQAINFYSALSWRFDDSELDFFFNYADTDLRGNGSSPIELLALSRSAVFTHPDRTENELNMLNIVYQTKLGSGTSLNANLFYRDTNTSGFNGDGSTFQACSEPGFSEFLCFGDDDEQDDDDEQEAFEPAFDQNGNLVSSGFNALNNISNREQSSFGSNIELSTLLQGSENFKHNIVLGVSYLNGDTEFQSDVEFAALNPNRSTAGSGLLDPSALTDLRSQTETFGAYFSDVLEVGDYLELGVAARFNSIGIDSLDLSGQRPDLNASNTFSRINFGVNGKWNVSDTLTAYAAWGQSTRSPSPVELACSHPDAPCTLPNTFLADPPLDEVVSSTFEIGLDGNLPGSTSWKLGLFHTTNKDDIIFQTTGGVSSNIGFFENVSDTRRVGVEAAIKGNSEIVKWYLNYTYLRATFEDTFLSSSPNHPLAEDGAILVTPGSHIPSLPEHNLSAGLTVKMTPKLSLGLQADILSGQFLRGDEGNFLDELDAYIVFDIQLNYRLTDKMNIGLEVENLFDQEYNSFGLFGEADEIFESFDNPIFLSSSAPRGAWVKLAYNW